MKQTTTTVFLTELDKQLSQLMISFRELNRRVQPNDAQDALQQHFRRLFELQSYFQNHRNNLTRNIADSGDARGKQFELLYKSSLLLNHSLEAGPLLELALDTLLEMSQSGRGFIATLDEGGDFSFIAARNFQRRDIPLPEREISRSVIRRAWKLKRDIRVASDDPENSLLQRSSLLKRDDGPLICVPVFIDQEVKAVIYLDRFKDNSPQVAFNLVKPFSLQLAAYLRNADEFSSLRTGNERLLRSLKEQFRFDGILGKNKTMVRLLKTIAKVAPTHASVLIQGETGTGKDLIARAIHENGNRVQGTFVEVDCGALPPNLIESELFGYVKGAFTGANEDRVGLLEAAHGGTLFLDEINNLPMESQTKLLRVLQQRKLRRIGETRERPLDLRVVSASSKNLKAMALEERFRQDLLYRINTVVLELPALRNRKDDLLLLTTSFINKFAEVYQRPPLILGPEVLTALECYDWPGNVRELEHVIERAVILCEGDHLTLSDLPFELHGTEPTEQGEKTLSLEAYLRQSKKYYITKILRENEGKKAETARKLQVNRSYLFQLIKQLEIET